MSKEIGTAQAVAATGTLMILSMQSNVPLEEVASQTTANFERIRVGEPGEILFMKPAIWRVHKAFAKLTIPDWDSFPDTFVAPNHYIHQDNPHFHLASL